MTWTAVYVDAAGIAFSCPIAKVGNNFVLATQDGPKPISYYITGADLAGGYATFHTYRIDGMPNLRGCDAIALIDRMNQTLPRPQRPAEPPKTKPEDTRLHVERRPGESNLAALQRAYGEKEITAQCKARQQARNQAQSATVDPRTAQQAQQARQERNEIAALKRRG